MSVDLDINDNVKTESHRNLILVPKMFIFSLRKTRLGFGLSYFLDPR